MKNLNFSLVFQMTECSSWRSGAFSVAFNRDTAIPFLFLWGTEIWGKHNSLLRSSETCSNCSLSWLVLQPFVSLRPTSLPPSVLRFSHSFFCFSHAKQQSTNPQRKINCSVKKKKEEERKKKTTSELQSSKLNFRHSLCVCAASELQRVGSGRGGYRRLADVWEWELSLKQLFAVSLFYIDSHDAWSGGERHCAQSVVLAGLKGVFHPCSANQPVDGFSCGIF